MFRGESNPSNSVHVHAINGIILISGQFLDFEFGIFFVKFMGGVPSFAITGTGPKSFLL